MRKFSITCQVSIDLYLIQWCTCRSRNWSRIIEWISIYCQVMIKKISAFLLYFSFQFPFNFIYLIIVYQKNLFLYLESFFLYAVRSFFVYFLFGSIYSIACGKHAQRFCVLSQARIKIGLMDFTTTGSYNLCLKINISIFCARRFKIDRM